VAPPSHNTAALEPLRVDTCELDVEDSELLHSLLSDCSQQWLEPTVSGPSPAASELSVATYSSPGDPSPVASDYSGATYPSPTAMAPLSNGFGGPQQYAACAVQSPPQACSASVQPSPQGYCGAMQSPQGYCANMQSPPQGYVANVRSVQQGYPGSVHVSPGYVTAVQSPPQAYMNTSPRQCFPSPAPGRAPNGQHVSPPYGQPVRQSCQFQPMAAPASTAYQQDAVFLAPAQPQQTFMPDFAQHSQDVLLNRQCMTESAMDTGGQLPAELSLDLAGDLPLLLTPPTSASAQPAADDSIMNWSHG